MVGIVGKIKYQKEKCKNTYQNSKSCGEGQGWQNAIAAFLFFCYINQNSRILENMY